MINSNSGFEYP